MANKISREHPPQKKRSRKRRRKKFKILKIIIGLILVCFLLAVIICFGVFRIKTVEIVGNTRNTEAKIEKSVLSGPFSSSSLLMSWLKKKYEPDNLSFVESVQVEMVARDTVRIHVSETQIIGYVKYLDCYMYFDKNGIVVESQVAETRDQSDMGSSESAEETATTVTPTATVSPTTTVGENSSSVSGTSTSDSDNATSLSVTDVPYITGLSFDSVALNEKIPVEDDSVFNTIQGLTRMVTKYNIKPDRVEFDEKYNMTLYYGNIRISLGKDSLLEEKIMRVAAILPKLDGKSGVLDLADYSNDTENIIFTQDESTDTSTESDASDTSDTSDEESTDSSDESSDESTDSSSDGTDEESSDGSYDDSSDTSYDSSDSDNATSYDDSSDEE